MSHNGPKLDIIGRKFHKLVALEPCGQAKGGGALWRCRCECGREKITSRSSLRKGLVKSCGCVPKGPRPTKPKKSPPPLSFTDDGTCCIKGCDRPLQGHQFCRSHYAAWRHNGHPLHFLKRRTPSVLGKSATKEYKTWHAAKQRCTKAGNRQWMNYGGRGIKMCDRWLNSFDLFLEDMGRAPTQRHSIERKDVNGNYEPSNCIWATKTEQSRNTRSTVLNVTIVSTAKARHLKGEIPRQIANDMGVSYYALVQALAGASWADVEPAGNA